MDIKFLEILPKRGRLTEALFEVGERDIKAGVTHKFRSIYNIGPEGEVELFLKQFGELIIRKMLAGNNLSDYVFKACNFIKANGQSMDLGEIKEKLESDIIKRNKGWMRIPEDLDFPLYDLDPRRVLESFSKEVKEKPINTGPYENGQIEASPLMLALTIMCAAQSHLNLILNDFRKRLGSAINKKKKTKLFLELLALYYFLTGENIKKYLKGDQFTLFALRLHVELLDNLPKIRETLWLFGANPPTRQRKIEEIVGDMSYWKTEISLSIYIHRGERFYIKNKPTDEEKEEMRELKKFLLAHDFKTTREYERSPMLQFLVKGFYRTCKILNLTLPKDLEKIMILYISHSLAILATQEHVARHIKPAWHDKK